MRNIWAAHETIFGPSFRDRQGQPKFTDPISQTVPQVAETRFRGNVVALRQRNDKAGLGITPDTPIPLWEGEKMDDTMAVEALLWLESPERSGIEPREP